MDFWITGEMTNFTPVTAAQKRKARKMKKVQEPRKLKGTGSFYVLIVGFLAALLI